MTVAQKWSGELAEARRNPDYLAGWRSSPSDHTVLFDLVAAGHSVQIDDGEMTGNAHRWRWLVIDGDHIGQRESMRALYRLARRCLGLDAAGLSALKSSEIDREECR